MIMDCNKLLIIELQKNHPNMDGFLAGEVGIPPRPRCLSGFVALGSNKCSIESHLLSLGYIPRRQIAALNLPRSCPFDSTIFIIELQKNHPNMDGFLAGEVGIEPTLKVLETLVLPLYYSP